MANQIKNRTILIGCDELSQLSIMLSALSEPGFRNYSFLTVSRPDQLLHMASENKIAMVILGFKRCQNALNLLFSRKEFNTLPVFCFTQNFEDTLKWPNNTNVFTYPLSAAHQECSIASRVISVLTFDQQKETTIPETFVPEYKRNEVVRDLSRYALELDQKNAILDRVRVQVETISMNASNEVRSELRSLLLLIRQSKSDQRYWQDFKEYFDKMNPDFFQVLSEKHPSLTAKDLKYCCYLRMNLSNNEITRLMGINQESVRTHKYRLKKKMALSKEQNLEHYLIRVNSSGKITA